MDYFYDTEFIEDGQSIDLVSIGVVCSDGREFYAVSTEADHNRANPWVRKHVLPHLPNPSSPAWKNRDQIRQGLEEFFGDDRDIRLWAWVGAYDHICLVQLWGIMQDLPPNVPRYTRELKHIWEFVGRPALPKAPKNAHDALADARHNVEKYSVCAREFARQTGCELR